tara:strand:- start:799 stop:1230 length:432 start_codon:yes stop_codon:yes gene_type:complete
MFTNTNNNDRMKKTDNKESINIIGQGTTVQGDINSTGDLRIDGTLKGSIKTEGKLVLGQNGHIEGDVVCQNADVSGKIDAKITVSNLLSLKETAKLNGDIITSKLSIEPGATFTGSCSMGAIIKDIKDINSVEEKQEQKEKTA